MYGFLENYFLFLSNVFLCAYFDFTIFKYCIREFAYQEVYPLGKQVCFAQEEEPGCGDH